MFDFSPVQIAMVLIIALIVFGPKRLPEMGRTLGKGMRDFRSSLSGHTDSDAPTSRATADNVFDAHVKS